MASNMEDKLKRLEKCLDMLCSTEKRNDIPVVFNIKPKPVNIKTLLGNQNFSYLHPTTRANIFIELGDPIICSILKDGNAEIIHEQTIIAKGTVESKSAKSLTNSKYSFYATTIHPSDQNINIMGQDTGNASHFETWLLNLTKGSCILKQ